MECSNNHDGYDGATSGEITLSSNQPSEEPSDITAGINAMGLHQTGDESRVPYNTFRIAAGASTLPGTLYSDSLKTHLSETQKTFVPTKTFEDIGRLLEKNCHVTICGASGEGKTSISLMLGQKYRKQGYELIFVARPDVFDLGSCLSSGQKVCLIFDDIFGSFGKSIDVERLCDTLKLHIDKCLQRKAHKNKQKPKEVRKDNKKRSHKTTNITSKDIRVIFTSTDFNFKDGFSKIQYQHISMFRKSVVDLTIDPGSSYSQPEKRAMFDKHREIHPGRNLGDLKVDELIKLEPTLFGFPLTCRLFFEFSAFTERGIDFFRRLMYYLRRELNIILSRRNEQAAALMLVLLNEENVKHADLVSPKRNKKIDEILILIGSLTHSSTRSGIAGAARSFRGTFLSRGDNLCFAHSSIYEAWACALYQFNPTFVLQYCSLDFLFERMKPRPVDESGVSDQLSYIFVSEEYFPLVVTRFVSLVKEGIFSKTVAHPMMRNKPFVIMFLEEVSKLATDTKAWIQWKETGKGFLYWVVKSNGIYLVQNIEKFLHITFTPDDIREALLASVECDSWTLLKHLMGKLEGKLDKSNMNKLLLTSVNISGKEMVTNLLEMGANVSAKDKNKRTFIHLLCMYDRVTILELVTLHSKKEEIHSAMDSLDNDRRTPLMLAAVYGTWDCFKLLKSEVKTSVKECESLIHLACKGGNKDIVKSVLTANSLNSRGEYGRTPIMLAARECNSDVFDLLLSQRADVTLVDDNGNTLLHYACTGGNRHIVESVLTPQNLISRGQDGWTPIMVAAYEATSDIFDLLLSQRADATLVDDNGNTLLHFVCAGGNKHIVESVLTPQNLNSRGQDGWTPIMVAAYEATSDIFDLLLSQRADVTPIDDNANTLLHLACFGGDKHIVESVLTPQNLNSRGQHGMTPIMVAAREAKPDIVDLLLSQRADVTLVNENGNALLHYACSGANKHIVESVLTPQNLNSRGQHGMTPIMVAAREAKPDIVDLLLSQRADVTLVNENGNALLHYACAGANKHIVESVLTPQNVNSRGENGRTPIMEAARVANSDIVDLLLSHNANVTLSDDDRDGLIPYACEGKNKYIIETVLALQNLDS